MTETVHNRHKLFGWMLFGATVLVISSGTGYVYAYHGRMAPRTQINGVSIGYMTKAEATSVITRQEETFLKSPLRMNYPDGVITVQPKLLGLTFNNASALDLAYANADQQTLLLRVQQLLTAPFHSHNYPDFVYPISDTGRAYLRQALPSSVEQSATETSLSFIPNATTVNAGIAGHLVDLLALSRALANAYSSHSSSISLELTTFQPTVSLAGAQTALTQAQSLLSTPWIVQIGSQTLNISDQEFAKLLSTSIVPATKEASASLSLEVQPDALQALVTSLAKQSDRVASNALLSVVNGAVVVTQPDIDGLVVNQPAVLSAITLAIATPPISHKIELQTTLTKAAIRS